MKKAIYIQSKRELLQLIDSQIKTVDKEAVDLSKLAFNLAFFRQTGWINRFARLNFEYLGKVKIKRSIFLSMLKKGILYLVMAFVLYQLMWNTAIVRDYMSKSPYEKPLNKPFLYSPYFIFGFMIIGIGIYIYIEYFEKFDPAKVKLSTSIRYMRFLEDLKTKVKSLPEREVMRMLEKMQNR